MPQTQPGGRQRRTSERTQAGLRRQATYIGKSSITCTQVISIWRWTDSTWVDLDTRQVGTTEVEVAGVGPSGSLDPFVSGASGLGDVRMRVSCSNTDASVFSLSGDLLKITV